MSGAEGNRSHDARDAWMRKPSLRAVYTDLYRQLAARCVPGLTVEVGGGSGNFKDYAPNTVSTDIVSAPGSTRWPMPPDSPLQTVRCPTSFFSTSCTISSSRSCS